MVMSGINVGIRSKVVPSPADSHCKGSSNNEFCEKTIHITAQKTL